MKRFIKIIRWIFLFIFLLITGFIVLGYFFVTSPRAEFTPKPMSRSAFISQFGDIGLPQTASNILYARSKVGMGTAGARIYRFDAPLVDCKAYARKLLSEDHNQTSSSGPMDLVALKGAPEAIDRRFLKKAYGINAEWFDIEAIREGGEGHGPPSGLGLMWIDAKRERFYYYWTD